MKNFSELFEGILRNFDELSGILGNFRFRTFWVILKNFREFVGIVRNFWEF